MVSCPHIILYVVRFKEAKYYKYNIQSKYSPNFQVKHSPFLSALIFFTFTVYLQNNEEFVIIKALYFRMNALISASGKNLKRKT